MLIRSPPQGARGAGGGRQGCLSATPGPLRTVDRTNHYRLTGYQWPGCDNPCPAPCLTAVNLATPSLAGGTEDAQPVRCLIRVIRHATLRAVEPPMVLRRRLAAELKDLRRRSGLTIQEAADQAGLKKSSISRYENFQTVPRPETLEILLTIYQVTPDLRAYLIELAKRAAHRGWWTERGLPPVPGWLVNLVSMEVEASELRMWHHLIPGLFQTEAYARAVMGSLDAEDIDRRVVLRLARQRKVLEEARPRIHAVIDQVALLRQVADETVMRDQLAHLGRLSRHPRITLQVLPLARGSYSAWVSCGFTVLDYVDRSAPSVFMESLGVGDHLEDAELVARHRLLHEGLADAALSPGESRGLFTLTRAGSG